MRRFVIFLILMVFVVCPFPHQMDLETRKQKRKQFQKEIIECILESDKISSELKQKVEENKDENSKKILHLYTSDLKEEDREVIRKCRRQYFLKIRNMYKEGYHERFNRNFTHHFPEEHEIHPFGPKHLRHGNYSRNYSEYGQNTTSSNNVTSSVSKSATTSSTKNATSSVSKSATTSSAKNATSSANKSASSSAKKASASSNKNA